MKVPHRVFDTARVILLSIGHGIHDMYPAFLAPLLPLLQVKLGLSNTLAGFLATSLLLMRDPPRGAPVDAD